MKKMKRAICLITVFVMCISLCGCSVLDDIRESRGIYTAEGNIQLTDGTEYAPLPSCKELSPSFTQYKELYVVQSDVPLLLTSIMGTCFDISDDDLFLSSYVLGEGGYYCRTDLYESVLERIENGFIPEVYAYWCYDYTSGKNVPYTLTQAEQDAVDQVCDTQEPQELLPGTYLSWDYGVYLYLCSEDLLFTKETVKICVADNKYYVVDETGANTVFYCVPAELTATFAQIIDTYIQNEAAYWNDVVYYD